jgi:hypothetical protein
LPLVSKQQAPEKQQEGSSVNWDLVKEALVAYEVRPSEETARCLLAAIPEKRAVSQIGDRKAVAIALIESISFEKAIISGDALLAETAFRLLGYMQGGLVDEELRKMLGRFLTKKPEDFLRLLKEYQSLFVMERNYPIDMTEILDIVPDITSKEDSRIRKKEETRLFMERIKALESVEDPELTGLRDACIRVIRAIINKL